MHATATDPRAEARSVIENEIAYRREHGESIPRYAIHKEGTSIAAQSDGRWVAIAGQMIGGKGWMAFSHELLVNGQPMHKQEDWVEYLPTPADIETAIDAAFAE